MTANELPPRHRTRPDLCVELDHPGVTYNGWHNKTYCLCGERVYDGRAETVDKHLACCEGPLTEVVQ